MTRGKTGKGGTRSSKVRGIQWGVSQSLSTSKIAVRKKDDEQKAYIAWNGKQTYLILNIVYSHCTRVLSPEEHALVECLRDQSPVDDQDPDWEMADDGYEGHELMGISPTGGENEALDGLHSGVDDTCSDYG